MNSPRPRADYTPDFFAGNHRQLNYIPPSGGSPLPLTTPLTHYASQEISNHPRNSPRSDLRSGEKGRRQKGPGRENGGQEDSGQDHRQQSRPGRPPGRSEIFPANARPTREQIEQAAYFNYRTRAEKGLPGDSHSDWVAAERKLKTD
jgi:hypothetical protein